MLNGYSLAEYIHVFWDYSLFSTYFPSWTFAGKGIYGTVVFNRNDIAEKDKLYEKLVVNFVQQFEKQVSFLTLRFCCCSYVVVFPRAPRACLSVFHRDVVGSCPTLASHCQDHVVCGSDPALVWYLCFWERMNLAATQAPRRLGSSLVTTDDEVHQVCSSGTQESPIRVRSLVPSTQELASKGPKGRTMVRGGGAGEAPFPDAVLGLRPSWEAVGDSVAY